MDFGEVRWGPLRACGVYCGKEGGGEGSTEDARAEEVVLTLARNRKEFVGGCGRQGD